MKKYLLFVMSVLFAGSLFAQDIPATLLSLHSANERVECGFTEQRVMPKVHKTENRKGTLVYQAPDDLRLDYTEPAGDFVNINAEKMEVCNKGKTQSVKVKNRSNRYATYRATLLSCIAGDVNKAAELNDAQIVCEKKGNVYVCTITAEHASNKEIEQIKLEYDVKTGAVLKITLTEGNGNYSTFTTIRK